MTQPWPGPSDVDQSTLHLGEELGSGGQGRVLRVQSQPGIVFKQYKVPGADQGALKMLVDLPAQLQQSERDLLHRVTAWPVARVFNKGQLSGFLMREIPGPFFGPNSVGSMKLRELQYLVYQRKPMWGEIVPNGEVPARTRIEVASEFTRLLTLLHARALVVGDVSMANVLWAETSAAAMIFLIDCDGIRRLGSRPVLKQPDTLDWNDPFQPASGPDLDTDRYKVALLVGRALTVSPYLRPGEPLAFVPGIPDRMAARLTTLWKQAAGPRGTRPDASQWSLALSNRTEIVLPPLPPIRQVPSLPLKELDGSGKPRPVIKLPRKLGP